MLTQKRQMQVPSTRCRLLSAYIPWSTVQNPKGLQYVITWGRHKNKMLRLNCLTLKSNKQLIIMFGHFLFRFSVRVAGGCCFLGPHPVLLMGEGQGTPWMSHSLQDPYWWQWLPHRVPTAHQESHLGYLAQGYLQLSPTPRGFEPATFR